MRNVESAWKWVAHSQCWVIQAGRGSRDRLPLRLPEKAEIWCFVFDDGSVQYL